MDNIDRWQKSLNRGIVIPASPLALTAGRRFDERRQRALCRYYFDAGAGGLAAGVHTTQFAIHDPKIGLLKPVLELVAEELGRLQARRPGNPPFVRIAGVCGGTPQAITEAELASSLGYHAVLLSLGTLQKATGHQLIVHCRRIAEIIPIVGFYLQPAAGGRVLPFSFWRRFAEIENVVAIKIAPFNRYQTLDVIRAVAEAGREDIALYTGNDDNIVLDLLTPYRVRIGKRIIERRIVGGLLGHWSVWTKNAVELHAECQRIAADSRPVPRRVMRRAVEVTDCNAAFFDAANHFAGCIPGLHEILRRQGLLAGTWCLDKQEKLSPGQRQELDRVCRAYPQLNDDDFVASHRDAWLRD